ncbi:thiamine ABC transporter substrate-binding protein [Halobacteria archaeon AArc-dxtr1]|nr:thiamine ABC transporter substrate-binding protein [Halobacteria archaeon AArc-dxtr1]
MNRRELLRAGGCTAAATLAGCVTRDNDEADEDEGVLRVATLPSIAGGDEESATAWIADEFEQRQDDIELTWVVPEDGLEYYYERREFGDDAGADVFLGLGVDDLVETDERLADETRLFESIDRDRLDRNGRIRDGIAFDDPDDRAVPISTEYLALVYDERDVDEPETLAELTEPAYERELLTQSAQFSGPGRAFLLWTVAEFGDEQAFEYWQELRDNGVRIVDDWHEPYRDVYREGARSVMVAPSGERALATSAGLDSSRYRLSFPDGRGYERTTGAAIFADSPRTSLAYEFIDFLLQGETQAEIAVRDARLPAVAAEHVDLDGDRSGVVDTPDASLSLRYDELSGPLSEWVDDWTASVAR